MVYPRRRAVEYSIECAPQFVQCTILGIYYYSLIPASAFKKPKSFITVAVCDRNAYNFICIINNILIQQHYNILIN